MIPKDAVNSGHLRLVCAFCTEKPTGLTIRKQRIALQCSKLRRCFPRASTAGASGVYFAFRIPSSFLCVWGFVHCLRFGSVCK